MLVDMNVKDTSGKDWKLNEEHVIENWRKGDAYYIVAESLAEVCSVVMWKAELVSDELGYLAQEISKQNIEDAALFFLAIAKCERKEINWMKNFWAKRTRTWWLGTFSTYPHWKKMLKFIDSLSRKCVLEKKSVAA